LHSTVAARPLSVMTGLSVPDVILRRIPAVPTPPGRRRNFIGVLSYVGQSDNVRTAMPEAFRLCNIFEDNYRPDQNNDIDKKK